MPVNAGKRETCFEAARLDYWCVRKRENCWLKMRRAAAEVCGKMCLTPPSMTALPVGNMEYIHLRTGGFMVPHCLASVLLSAHFRDSSPQARSFISPFGNLKTIFTCYHSLLFYCALSDGILQRSAISLRGCGHCPASLTDVSYLEVVLYQ